MSSDAIAVTERPSRVVVLGLDGLGQEFLSSPIVDARMPNLRALLEGSASGPLTSTLPPYTAPAWTSITTGLDPASHGVFGFTDRLGRPVTAASTDAPRIWDHVGRAGGRSVVVNVPLTHPSREIDGVLISGMPVPPGAPFAPAAVASLLDDAGYVVDVPVREGAREPRGVFERLRAMTAARGRVVSRLAARQAWDLLMVVFVLPDRLGHPWWKALVPGDPHYATRRSAAIRASASHTLRALDEAIGELLAALPGGTAVIVCSDHGLGSLRAEVFFDLVLAERGIVEAPTTGPVRSRLVRLARTRAGKVVPASVRRRARSRIGTGTSGAAWTGRPYEAGVWLRDPADDATAARVEEALSTYEDPDGRTIVGRIRRSDAGAAPDLLVEMRDERVDLHDGTHAASPWVSRERTSWGTHRREGVVALAGVGAQRSAAIAGAAPDVAATALALLGIGVEGLDGRSLVDVAGPTRVLEAIPRGDGGAPAYDERDEAAVLEHLRGLGYVD